MRQTRGGMVRGLAVTLAVFALLFAAAFALVVGLQILGEGKAGAKQSQCRG